MSIKKLESIGFERVGQWKLKENRLDFECSINVETTKILYCFVINDEVVYVGKTIKSIKQRFQGYIIPGSTQFTNQKVNKKINESISSDDNVIIYIFKDYGYVKFGEFDLNIPAGLEDSIIETINPQWNNMGKSN